MSLKDKWVRRFSVDETSKHSNGFTIYKITSVLFPLDSPEAVTVVSVWKRYSDVQVLHKSMKSLHAGLHLRGDFPELARWSYFKRFDREVIIDRARTIKQMLEFIAEHRLLFTSTDFVNFLQTGYPEPVNAEPLGTINAIRSSLHLPLEDNPPIEYHTDDEGTTPRVSANENEDTPDGLISQISRIPIYEAAEVETRRQISKHSSFDSLTSIDQIYDQIDSFTTNLSFTPKRGNLTPKTENSTPKSENLTPKNENITPKNENVTPKNENVTPKSGTFSLKNLPDLINFDVASTSNIERPESRLSESLSLSNISLKTKTDSSYVFEAGYLLNSAVKYEKMGDFSKAFDFYKAGIEKMLIGVKDDTDSERRLLIKEKTNKYMLHAEDIYRKYLNENQHTPLPPLPSRPPPPLGAPPSSLSQYRVLGVLGETLMLVHCSLQDCCYAMKVIQKVPNNLTDFDETYLKNVHETKRPILPNAVPYMVQLISYIETQNLIFLVLTYAPGEKLFKYIDRYVSSIPNTPNRTVNLENVFAEPKKIDEKKNDDFLNENCRKDNFLRDKDSKKDFVSDKNNTLLNDNKRRDDFLSDNTSNDKFVNDNSKIDDSEVSVNELVMNSQKLLMNVDKALSVVRGEQFDDDVGDDVDDDHRDVEEDSDNSESDRSDIVMLKPRGINAIPRSSITRWAAELLTALEYLHNCGVVCRDLNPDNILLNDRGTIILTYFIGYNSLDMVLAMLQTRKKSRAHPYIAPELYRNMFLDEIPVNNGDLGRVCDFWSFGVVLYELICGVPLSYYHRSMFTSHTILFTPEGLDYEAQSLLMQLLTYEPSERLGAGKEGIQEIKRHPYFKHIDWNQIYNDWIPPR